MAQYEYEIGYGAEIDEGLLEELLSGDEDIFLGHDYDEDDYAMGAVSPRMASRFRRSVPSRRSRPAPRTRRAPARRGPSPFAAAMAARKAASGVIVREAPPTKGREKAMGMASAAVIVAAATGSVTARPQMLFRAERFVVPASISAAFLLNFLNIGVANQLVTSDALPCETLQEGAVGAGLKLDSAAVGLDITANVTNISLADVTFRATIFGTTAE